MSMVFSSKVFVPFYSKVQRFTKDGTNLFSMWLKSFLKLFLTYSQNVHRRLKLKKTVKVGL